MRTPRRGTTGAGLLAALAVGNLIGIWDYGPSGWATFPWWDATGTEDVSVDWDASGLAIDTVNVDHTGSTCIATKSKSCATGRITSVDTSDLDPADVGSSDLTQAFIQLATGGPSLGVDEDGDLDHFTASSDGTYDLLHHSSGPDVHCVGLGDSTADGLTPSGIVDALEDDLPSCVDLYEMTARGTVGEAIAIDEDVVHTGALSFTFHTITWGGPDEACVAYDASGDLVALAAFYFDDTGFLDGGTGAATATVAVSFMDYSDDSCMDR